MSVPVNPIKEEIEHSLFNYTLNPEQQGTNDAILIGNKQMMFEQYKLLVDSAHKIEERRGGSNTFFVSINTLFASFVLINPLKLSAISLKELVFLELVIFIGLMICWDWLRVMHSYKRLNSINYHLIQAFEKTLPTFVFSLRVKIEAEEEGQAHHNRANIVLVKENVLPKAFLLIYGLYFSFLLYLIYQKY